MTLKAKHVPPICTNKCYLRLLNAPKLFNVQTLSFMVQNQNKHKCSQRTPVNRGSLTLSFQLDTHNHGHMVTSVALSPLCNVDKKHRSDTWLYFYHVFAKLKGDRGYLYNFKKLQQKLQCIYSQNFMNVLKSSIPKLFPRLQNKNLRNKLSTSIYYSHATSPEIYHSVLN